MAQDAELKLKVSLDLAFFRQQLNTIGTQLGGQSVPIAIRFDKKAIADQYRLLDRYIRGKKFTVELNLVGGLTKNEFDKIKGRLDDLRDLRKVEIPVSIKNGATGTDVDKVIASIKERLAKNQQIKQGGGKLRIETSVKPSITNEDIAVFKKAVKDKLSKIGALEIPTKLDVPKVEDLLKALQKNINRQKPLLAKTSIKPSILSADVKAFKKAVESKLSGITVKINAELETIGGGKTKAQIEKEVLAGLERIQQMGAERMGGGVTEPARRESLRQSLQGRDIGELKDIGRQLGVANVGKFRNTQNLIERIVTEASIEMITKYLDPQAVMRNPDRSGLNKVLDTFARGLFNMLGMDVASMRQQAAQRRALPGVNFPATVPSRPVSIGPSGTGRALPPGAIPGALPGTAFGAQKYLPTNLGIELQKILRKAAYAFVDAVRQQVRTAKIGIGASMQAALPAARVAGLLPASVGREPSRYAMGGESREQMMARRTAEAYARSALRGMDVMGGGTGRAPSPYSYAYRSARPTSAIVPYAQPGAIVPSTVSAGGGAVPPGGGGGGGFGMGGLGGFGRAIGGINLPGSGIIRELGDEFGFAAKQVLLFGTAYKALAFFQNFPAQVGAVVGQLQTFRNTLGAISPTAQEAASSNQLILDLVEKYNVPLQSARDGFTKLYASMAPAGFSGDEIRDLFTGITQAAATFGMSADKVDRVNYAFAQMASKGQVMSEELKGQLGDVLPGAMALFAEAAGFEGPKAIQDFSAALEDGAYKGEAMVALLKNVGVIMQQEFGPGAEGAARTFQGVINRMQNSMTLLYESFEPVAVGFLNSVVVPLTSGIKQISDGFNAFFTGAAAQTTGGFGIAQELERLRPAFEGIAQNVAGLAEQFGQFASAALEVGKVLLQIAGNPIVGYLARLYAIALPINIALNVMRGLWAANALQLLIFNARVATGTSTLSAFRGMMAATGATAQTTAASIRTAGITLRTFFATTGVGLVIVGISMLIEKFMSMNQALADTKAKALGAAQAIRSMSQTEARAAEQQAQSAYQLIGQISGRAGVQQPGGDRLVPVSQKELSQLQQLGAIRSQQTPGGPLYVKRSEAMALAPQAQRLQSEAAFRQRQIKFEEQQMQQQAVLAPIPPSEGDAKTKKGKELDQYIQDASNALALEKERQLVAIEDKMLRDEISETEAKRQSLLVEKLYEEKAVTEGLRVAQLKLADDNLSAADKQLKLADLRAEKEQKIANIGAKYGVEVLKLELGLQQPIKDAISGANEQLDEQAMIRENLKDGIIGLTYDQKAYLDVQRLTKEYGDAEKESVRERINEYQRLREEYYKNEDALKKQQALSEAQTGLGIIGGGLRAGFTGSAAGVFERAMEQYGDTDYATQLANIETSAMQLRSVFDGLQGAISGVSGAFANMLTEGITGMITGTATAKEVFASFLQSVGQALSQAASQMIATYIAIGIAKMFAGLGGGGGNPAGSGGGISDILPGARQYMGGADVAGNFTPNLMGFANGGIVSGGFQAFANGGVVSGPTLGLIGEGKYNEAVVPLPNGKSIPVQFSGERSARDMMSRNAQAATQASPINLSFETTKIGNTEYVSRDQLEAAMAETRRAAINGGAARGMSMTLDRIQQSPSVRSRIGIR